MEPDSPGVFMIENELTLAALVDRQVRKLQYFEDELRYAFECIRQDTVSSALVRDGEVRACAGARCELLLETR